MSRSARRKKPTALKLLHGTSKPCRENANEPTPEASRPTPPACLSVGALAEWNRVVPELEANGLLSQLDPCILSGYCQAYARWQEAEEELKTAPLIIVTAKGGEIQNPLLGIANRAMQAAYRYGSEFGLSPASRTKVKAAPKKKASNPFDSI